MPRRPGARTRRRPAPRPAGRPRSRASAPPPSPLPPRPRRRGSPRPQLPRCPRTRSRGPAHPGPRSAAPGPSAGRGRACPPRSGRLGGATAEAQGAEPQPPGRSLRDRARHSARPRDRDLVDAGREGGRAWCRDPRGGLGAARAHRARGGRQGGRRGGVRRPDQGLGRPPQRADDRRLPVRHPRGPAPARARAAQRVRRTTAASSPGTCRPGTSSCPTWSPPGPSGPRTSTGCCRRCCAASCGTTRSPPTCSTGPLARARACRCRSRRPAAAGGPLLRRRLVGAGRRAQAVARRGRDRAHRHRSAVRAGPPVSEPPGVSRWSGDWRDGPRGARATPQRQPPRRRRSARPGAVRGRAPRARRERDRRDDRGVRAPARPARGASRTGSARSCAAPARRPHAGRPVPRAVPQSTSRRPSARPASPWATAPPARRRRARPRAAARRTCGAAAARRRGRTGPRWTSTCC